jgi:hypothetical protein
MTKGKINEVKKISAATALVKRWVLLDSQKLIILKMNRLKFLLVAFVFLPFICWLYSCNKDDSSNFIRQDTTYNLVIKNTEDESKLFREILFFHGINSRDDIKINSLKPAYDLVSEVKIKDENFSTELDRTILDLAKNIKFIDSNFFTKFNTEITSKNPLRIKTILDETHKILLMSQILSEKFRQSNLISMLISKDSLLFNDLKSINSFSNSERELKILEINNRIDQLILSISGKERNAFIPCTPGVVICVVHTVAVVSATAAVAVNTIGAVTVALKTAVVLWDKQWVWESPNPQNPNLLNEIMISEIANNY